MSVDWQIQVLIYLKNNNFQKTIGGIRIDVITPTIVKAQETALSQEMVHSTYFRYFSGQKFEEEARRYLEKQR